MWAEGPVVPAASQRNGRHTSCHVEHDSEYTTDDRSAVVNTSADDTSADVIAASDWAGEQAEQQRQFATAEVGESGNRVESDVYNCVTGETRAKSGRDA